MPLYSKQSQQLLVDLINASNPSLPVALTTTNAKYGTPAVITPQAGTIQNTSIRVTALASGQYIGNTTLNYRRLDFASLLRSVPVRIDKFSPANIGASPFKISDLISVINSKYGLNLQATDYVDGSMAAGNTNAVPAIGLVAGTRNSSITVNAAAGSYGYVGSFTLYWVQAPQDLATMITTPSLETARVFPGNRNVVDSSIYVVDLDTYSQDFTDYFGTGGTLSPTTFASQTINTVGSWPAFITMLNTLSGKTYTNTGNGSQAMDLVGSTTSAQLDMTLPANQALFPEANFKYYNRLMVVTLSANAAAWGAGKLFIHYNV
jgi:hypothetical protein